MRSLVVTLLAAAAWIGCDAGYSADVVASSAALPGAGPSVVSDPVSASAPVKLEFREGALRARIASGGVRLPEFHVYARSGGEIFASRGLADTFIAELETALAEPRESGDAPRFSERAAELEDAGGQPFDAQLAADAELVFVEVGADWCAPCRQQEQLLQGWLAAHPGRRVAWLQVNLDMDRIRALSEVTSEGAPRIPASPPLLDPLVWPEVIGAASAPGMRRWTGAPVSAPARARSPGRRDSSSQAWS